tara:strand:+ start:206 stop:409 length:204 start_codon:yes stop_codon:yes gene_type:complete
MKMKEFYWNTETLEYYSLHQNEIPNFVKFECDLEDGETEEDLIKDLTKQSKQYYKNLVNNDTLKYRK